MYAALTLERVKYRPFYRYIAGGGGGGGGGVFNFVCIGVFGHTTEKLTHPQTKPGPSINKTHPFSDYVQKKLTD